MMKLQTYAGFSLIAALAIIYHAFDSRGQFYPAMVYLSTSKISLVLLLNMGLVFMCILWQLTKKIFLGSLREAEVERLNEQSWREVMEILFAITIFRQDFSVTFLAMVTALLLIKSLHWLAQKRVEYIETTPTVPKLSHVRIVSFMVFLLLIDSIFLYDSVEHLIETRQASVALFFSFEYIILATTTLSTFVKYMFHVSDMLMEGQWEKKAVCTFYLELIRDLLHLTLCMCFFLVIFLNYGVPLHLIRELYETFRNFRIRVADYIRYRKVTSNMKDRFPDATPDELSVSDATCIICREEMIAAKKLVCGHLFHVNCLRSWLERQNTCPTCRALVIPPENGASTTSTRTNSQQQGTGTAGTSSEGSSGDGVANENVSQHQTRLQAAAAAATLYEKSFVYPSPNALMRSPGYASPSQIFQHSIIAKDGEEGAASELSEQFVQTTLDQLPQFALAPTQFPHVNGRFGEGTSSESHLDLQRKLIEHQIEFLQNQLQLLRNGEKTKDIGTSFDIKGKSVSSSSSSVIDSGEI
ncbi:ERAD-associated E3 ubiquitin-protein ligase HRD1B-like [Salvia miltiorrhiza]|uniref:ERAD-associated E3 ubiquitin-protein ligase HRD1B-like n=1 Tax=Salvia miltiorrhiza TaxID=226208 RepID=UPI0025AD223A|nr:ERAD-associated E3 ubiquitin-protein ligase HRD1B-like [Salvia miltiorrhiza]XP_057777300.1 ERAD-associated E3 ubiquitin-protein ligase HRD1B-like [Salvia miltiorrhiza]XP_057777302.1 ERAD-associated E3 ubiquitin-protein ligase HRD1B-like [Salvia miltiorrhiza]XP_057777303.1 ERAD-associated E3 ubiquitin-protein ligase HRD1B-like [Salvia miltiorrhiza]